MTITKFDLRLANYIQDKGSVDIDTCMTLYDKSESTIKRRLYSLNEYLPEYLHFTINNNRIYSNMTYLDFAELCDSIDIEDYSTSVEERIMLIICYAFLHGTLNTTILYNNLKLSLSTKKKDRKVLGEQLKDKNINIINRHRKGIELEGSERYLRMYVARKLMSVIELNERDEFIERKANTPIQKRLYVKFEEYLAKYHEEVTQQLKKIFIKTKTTVDYPSKKFIYIHTAISYLRINNGYSITCNLNNMPEVFHYNMLKSEKDSRYLDYLIASLNYKKALKFPINHNIKQLTEHIIDEVSNNKNLRFYSYNMMFEEIYSYLYKCQIKNNLDYYFYDDKLDDTKKVFPNLYQLVKNSIHQVKLPNILVTDEQVSTLCLIIETYIMQNRMVSEIKPKIIVITNSSVEKVNFFIGNLRNYVDFEMVSYLTINELFKLKNLDFDYIFTFSNRNSILLNELGLESIKLNFYLDNEDGRQLIDAGFNSNQNKKFLAKSFIDELDIIQSKNEKVEFLRTHYSNYFL